MNQTSCKNETEYWEIMNNIINSTWIAQSTCIIAKLGIPDFLSAGPKSINEIAQHTNTDKHSLFRVMRLLSEVGIFINDDQYTFCLTELGKTLQTDHPNSLRYAAIYLCNEHHWTAWGNLLYSIQTGQSAFKKLYSKDYFSFLDENPEDTFIFNECMKRRDKIRINTIVNHYDFTECKVIVDIGGGKGGLISEILKHNDLCKGILFDKYNVTLEAYQELKDQNILDRCEIISGDFFHSIPQTGDTYILSSILHDWSDDEAIKILRNCKEALKKTQKLLIIEKILDNQPNSLFTKSMDIEMLAIFGGKERTLQEYNMLLSRADLYITKVDKLNSIDIIECQLADHFASI